MLLKKSTIVSFKGDVFRETQYFLTLQSKMIFLKNQSRDKFFINTHNRKLSTSGLDSSIFNLCFNYLSIELILIVKLG